MNDCRVALRLSSSTSCLSLWLNCALFFLFSSILLRFFVLLFSCLLLVCANIIRFNVSNVSHVVYKPQPLSTRRFVQCRRKTLQLDFGECTILVSVKFCACKYSVEITVGGFISGGKATKLSKPTTKPEICTLVSVKHRCDASVYWTFQLKWRTNTKTPNKKNWL